MANRRQMICIYTIIDTLRIPFEGDFRSDREVENFIKRHYNKAAMVARQRRELEDMIANFTLQIGIENDVMEQFKKEKNGKERETTDTSLDV